MFTVLDTECVADLYLQSEIIIFEKVLINFEVSVIFRGSWGSSENWVKLKSLTTKSKFNQVKLVQILDTHYRRKKLKMSCGL